MADTDWDEAAIEDLLQSVDGPVGQMVQELSGQIAVVARNTVHIRTGPGGSTANPPGFTRGTITAHLGYGSNGIFGGANAAADPAIFLEYPADQMEHGPYPFLTTGLWSIAGEL
jgi:hypothetical protein